MAKAEKDKRDKPTSVKLTADLKSWLDEILPLRDTTISTLVHDLLMEYKEKNPTTADEARFLRSKHSRTARK